MNDIEARAERVRVVVEGNFGSIIRRDGNIIEVELPVDIAIGLTSVWGEGGFLPIFQGQTTRLVPRRVTDMNGNTIVCESDPVTTAFYRYTIDLGVDTRRQASPAPSVAEITRSR